MKFQGLHQLPKTFKTLIVLFLLCLSVGYASGLRYIAITSGMHTEGIEENYLGNEDNLEAEVMKFKKVEKELMSVVHAHILSYSLIFAFLGVLLNFSALPDKLKRTLIVESFLSILLTFGGIWLIWAGWAWFKYVVMISGVLLSISFFVSVLALLYDLYRKH